MKKAKSFLILVCLCILLFSFSSVLASSFENTLLSVNDEKVQDVKAQSETIEMIVAADGNLNNYNDACGVFSFTAKHTGVFTIRVTGYSHQTGRELYYVLKDSKGKEVRLVAYFDYEKESYAVFTNGNDVSSTTIDVLLKENETYTLSLSNTSSSPNGFDRPYSAQDDRNVEYKVSIEYNRQANNREVFQSDVSSRAISEDYNTKAGDLEEKLDEYAIPDNQEAVFDNYGIDDWLADVGKSVVDFASEYIVNPFEETICELLLAVGDFFTKVLSDFVGEDVTVTALVYNQIDSVNPNFFDKTVASSGFAMRVKIVVSEWYNIFKYIAIAVYVVALLAIGIQILLRSTADGLQKGKASMMQWLKGILYLTFVPYIVKYAFLINESLVESLREESKTESYKVSSSSYGSAQDWSAEAIEFRSPEYVSKYTGTIEFGSDQATEGYVKKISTYQNNLDLMRLMRAYAGVTKKIVYVIIWFILIGQLLSFIVQYYKRFFIIAILIAFFPLICIFNGISIARGNPGKEIGSWMTEMMTNIFMQSVQAIVYTIITSVCLSIVRDDINSSATLNWLLIIMAINFVTEGEKILRKLVGAMGSSAEGTAAASRGVKGAFNKGRKYVKRAITGVKEKEEKEEKEDE